MDDLLKDFDFNRKLGEKPDPVEICYLLDALVLMDKQPPPQLVDHITTSFDTFGFTPYGFDTTRYAKGATCDGWTETAAMFLISTRNLEKSRFSYLKNPKHAKLVERATNWLLENQFPKDRPITHGGWALGNLTRSDSVRVYTFATYLGFYGLEYFKETSYYPTLQEGLNQKFKTKYDESAIDAAIKDAISHINIMRKVDKGGEVMFGLYADCPGDLEKHALSTLYSLEALDDAGEYRPSDAEYLKALQSSFEWISKEATNTDFEVKYPYAPYYVAQRRAPPDIPDYSFPLLYVGSYITLDAKNPNFKLGSEAEQLLSDCIERISALLRDRDFTVYQGLAEYVNDYPEAFGKKPSSEEGRHEIDVLTDIHNELKEIRRILSER